MSFQLANAGSRMAVESRVGNPSLWKTTLEYIMRLTWGRIVWSHDNEHCPRNFDEAFLQRIKRYQQVRAAIILSQFGHFAGRSSDKIGRFHMTACGAMMAKALLLVFGFSSLSANAASYSITGTLTYEAHGLGELPGTVVQPRHRDFDLMVDDCTWTIKMVLAGNTNYNYFLSTYDGEKIIYASKLSQASFEDLHRKLQGRTSDNEKNLYQGCTVESGPVPRNLGSIANPYPWLAFCSGRYLKSLTNGYVIDIYPPNEEASRYAARQSVPCDFILSSLPPYLPIEMTFWWTNVAWVSADGAVTGISLPVPFKGKFLAATFKSEQFTNVNGLFFPTRFEMTEFRPLPQAKSEADFRKTVIVRGSVTSISSTSNQMKKTYDVLQGVQIVSDYRFTSNAPVTRYRITNGQVPAVDNANVLIAKTQAIRQLSNLNRQRELEPQKPKRWYPLAMLAISIVPICGYFGIKHRGKRVNKQ